MATAPAGRTLTIEARHLDLYLKAKSLVPAVPEGGRGVCVAMVLWPGRALSGAPSACNVMTILSTQGAKHQMSDKQGCQSWV